MEAMTLAVMGVYWGWDRHLKRQGREWSPWHFVAGLTAMIGVSILWWAISG